jgi:hypothetical protein
MFGGARWAPSSIEPSTVDGEHGAGFPRGRPAARRNLPMRVVVGVERDPIPGRVGAGVLAHPGPARAGPRSSPRAARRARMRSARSSQSAWLTASTATRSERVGRRPRPQWQRAPRGCRPGTDVRVPTRARHGSSGSLPRDRCGQIERLLFGHVLLAAVPGRPCRRDLAADDKTFELDREADRLGLAHITNAPKLRPGRFREGVEERWRRRGCRLARSRRRPGSCRSPVADRRAGSERGRSFRRRAPRRAARRPPCAWARPPRQASRLVAPRSRRRGTAVGQLVHAQSRSLIAAVAAQPD